MGFTKDRRELALTKATNDFGVGILQATISTSPASGLSRGLRLGSKQCGKRKRSVFNIAEQVAIEPRE